MHAFLKNSKSSTKDKAKSSQEVSTVNRKKTPAPWVEKYRPKSVDDVVEQGEVVAVLKQCLNGADLPNLLLYGPPGTGKTSTILAAARQLFGDIYKDRILELNASDERGIAVVRTKVKNFAQLTASGTRPDGEPCPPFKIIILDEADSMTHAAQAALRRTMEKESRTTRFCLVCNYVSRIIQPITSRCTKFRFKSLSEDKIIERLQYICKEESVSVDDDVYKNIVDISGGDMRRAITMLQSVYRLKGGQNVQIKAADILEISGVIPNRYLVELLDICKSGNYTNLEKYVADIINEAFSVGQLFQQLCDFIVQHAELTNKQKSVICDTLGKCCYRLEDGGSEYLQIMDLGCTIIKSMQTSTGGGNADVSIEYSADLSALSRLEDKIRLLQDDLESERELRQRIEREKADLSVQVIQMSERLEEAEGGAESQFNINRNRDVELLKLRKLLDDVHLESEETAHILKKKHQEIITDFQEQIEILTKSRQRAEKEKSKFQSEVYELVSQVESISKEKNICIKQVEKLEIQITELHVKIEELNRTIVDISSHKSRLSQENVELIKSVQDLKLSIESVNFSKAQLVSHLEDARRRLEDDERRRSILESSLHQVESELESTRVQLEEESEARLDLERQLVKSNGEAQQWHAKYDAEAAARAEEVEDIRRKYSARIQEQEEHIETLIVKINNLEKQKNRLQSEVEILIIDLEKANGTARELQKRVDSLERTSVELRSRLEETVLLYENSQRDLKNKQVELTRVSHELDSTRNQRDGLARENQKLTNENQEARNTITELTRRYHEFELELRRLENERDELTAAYKEAEAGRKAEEQRAQRLASEYGQYRHDAERRLAEKDEEVEAIRKQTAIEIEQLNARVVEAETRLKTEVARIKKKLQIHITELEMSLDVANKTNIDLQKIVKKQSLQLTELQGHYDEVQRQLQQTLDQYGIAQRRLQSLTGELEEIRLNYENALRSKRAVELQYEESQVRINEMVVVNSNLSSAKAKIEQEISQIASDYDEVTRELRLSDERYQKVQVELKHTVEILHEEQERIVKIEAIKKSLEVEVKNLSVRLEEVETNAVVGSRRIISKLESRIRDMELELEEEKRRHAETIKILRKKERTVKEVMIQCEEDQKNVMILQETLEKATQKINIYKRQLNEQEGMSQQSVTRARRFQRELEAAEDRADQAESNLTMIRSKHRTFVTTSTVPGSQVYMVQESRTISE